MGICPELSDCELHAETYDDALAKIREAIQVRIEDALADDEDIPQAETVNFTTLRLIL
jgi:predicted RNase H-like HicB family nuclease